MSMHMRTASGVLFLHPIRNELVVLHYLCTVMDGPDTQRTSRPVKHESERVDPCQVQFNKEVVSFDDHRFLVLNCVQSLL